jgi:hypothetical protein
MEIHGPWYPKSHGKWDVPGLIPAEKKKPLRRAPWEEPDSDDDLPEVELFQESKEEGI